MSDPKRALIAQTILDLVAGTEFETSIAAQCDALATGIGATFHLTGKSRHEAEAFVRALARDMAIRHIRKHWGTIELDRSYAGPAGSA